MQIRKYETKDELGWVRCRVLSFLDTAYYDNVLRSKEYYEHPSIELVAERSGQIIGLIDIELDQVNSVVCSGGSGLGGMIWHLAVHPDEQGKGVGTALLKYAVSLAKEFNICRFQAWTRDDKKTIDWYIARGFEKKQSYLHVYPEGRECQIALKGKLEGIMFVSAFAHYVGQEQEKIKSMFSRVHECNLYEYKFDK